MQRIAVIDYGMGNLRSVSKAIEHVSPDDEIIISSDAAVIESADKVVCPGQGAAADCMAALQQAGLHNVIRDLIHSRPFLGICMGMQVLLKGSEENGGVDCLGLLPGRAIRFAEPLFDSDTGVRLKVPHMGWSEVGHVQDHVLWSAIPDSTRFYFAHSYYCVPERQDIVVGTCQYGSQIAVAVAHDNYFACQFHPEKSGQTGLQLLRNFTKWSGES